MPPVASNALSTASTVATGFSLRRLVRSATRRKNTTNSHSASLGADPPLVNASTRSRYAPMTALKMLAARKPPSPFRPQNPRPRPAHLKRAAPRCHPERSKGSHLTHFHAFKRTFPTAEHTKRRLSVLVYPCLN